MRHPAILSLTAAVLSVSNSWLLAHPGHGTTAPDSPVHYVAEPVHAQWWLLFLAVGIAGIVWGGLRRARKPVVRKNRPGTRDV